MEPAQFFPELVGAGDQHDSAWSVGGGHCAHGTIGCGHGISRLAADYYSIHSQNFAIVVGHVGEFDGSGGGRCARAGDGRDRLAVAPGPLNGKGTLGNNLKLPAIVRPRAERNCRACTAYTRGSVHAQISCPFQLSKSQPPVHGEIPHKCGEQSYSHGHGDPQVKTAHRHP